jgi:hypothetical protein
VITFSVAPHHLQPAALMSPRYFSLVSLFKDMPQQHISAIANTWRRGFTRAGNVKSPDRPCAELRIT